VRQQELPEIDFATEISQALDTLETSVVEYQGREGTVNPTFCRRTPKGPAARG
jgi:hypothetical protein